MQLYDQTDGNRTFGSCCTLDDLHDARRVAAAINIPHYILNFERQFDEQVVSNFVREYASGRTPLPCAHCNSDLKFSTLLERARGFGADRVATGHYARVERDAATGRYLLRRGVDPAKDQSYFLFSLTQEQLACAVFPVGDQPKDAVREYAQAPSSPGRRQAGQPGNLLHPGQRLREVRDGPFPAGGRGATARSSTRVAACSAVTRASTGSRSASARDSACRARRARPAGGDRHRGAPVRAGAESGGSAGRCRPEVGARANDADGVRCELAVGRADRSRCASRPRFAIVISPRMPPCGRWAADEPRSSSTRRRSPSRLARPSFFYQETWSSAAGGSTRRSGNW